MNFVGVSEVMGKFIYYNPMWLFIIIVMFLLLMSACGTSVNNKPIPTFEPDVQNYRECLVKLTRTNRTDTNLDSAVLQCKHHLEVKSK